MARWEDDASLCDWLYDEIEGLKAKVESGDAKMVALALQLWVGQNAAFSHEELLLDHGKLSTTQALLEGLLNLEGGLWCGGVAELYSRLIRLFPGYYAAKWSYGYHAENVSHVTTLVGTKDGDSYIFDAYLGYVYLDSQTREMLPFGELIKRIVNKEYSSIEQLNIPQRRPALARPGHQANRLAWLYLNREMPEPRSVGGLLVYDDAECSAPALYRWGSSNRMRIERIRGDIPFEEFMYDMILVEPTLTRFAPQNSETWTEFSVMRDIIETVIGGIRC